MKKSAVADANIYLPKKKPLSVRIKNALPFLIMILPGFIALALFAYKPLYGLLIAFKEYKLRLGVFASPWADNHGFEYFIDLFKGARFANSLGNTLVISLASLFLNMPFTIILALLINEMRGVVYKRIVQTITYLPHFFSWVVLGGIFKTLFAPIGPVNSALMNLGFESVPFLTNGGAFMTVILSTKIWQSMGWGAIIYIAALSGVDESLYEAAYIDGASRWKQVWHISIPSILGTIVTVFILNLGGILNAGYEQIYNMYNALVKDAVDVLDTYILETISGTNSGGSYNYGIGTALGLFKSVVGLVLVLVSNKFVSVISNDEYGIL